MHVRPIPPTSLTAAQRPLYDSMKAGVAVKHDLFTTIQEVTLLGPWDTWLHQPEVGEASWATLAMTRFAMLPDAGRQIVILAVGAHFGTAYEIYAHARSRPPGTA